MSDAQIPDGLRGKPLFDWLKANKPEIIDALMEAVHAEIVVWAYETHPEDCRRITIETVQLASYMAQRERQRETP